MPADITTIYPLITPYAGACPVPVVKQKLILAARNFCRLSEWWKEDLVAQPTDTDETDYQLRVMTTGTHDGGDDQAILTDSTAVWTVDAWIGFYLFNITDGSYGIITDNDATTITATLANGTDNDWDDDDVYEIRTHPYDARIHRVKVVKIDDSTINPADYTVTRDYLLELDSEPVEDDLDLDVNVVLWPEATCWEYPQILLDKYDQDIADGALSYLLAMSDKPWADMDRSRELRRDFNHAINQAKEEVFTDRKAADLIVDIPEL